MNATRREQSSDDLRSVRSQAAVVRALLDELERMDARWSGALDEQLAEELARLGCRMLETASDYARRH